MGKPFQRHLLAENKKGVALSEKGAMVVVGLVAVVATMTAVMAEALMTAEAAL